MKATELMIGDWVEFTSISHIRSRINCISPYQRYAGHTDNATWFDSFDDIQPIPLTEEILLANGFKYLEDYRSWALDNNFYLFKFGEALTIIACDREIKIQYVHKLQHILRDCGLDDLADNFKIE